MAGHSQQAFASARARTLPWRFFRGLERAFVGTRAR